ncbi:PREDICTED: NAC domain-containing protein 43-like [Fragaria vesca subsp. vesca]|uniref:NAC domain-containing protein 43-like n=1 Tax=Fragaria vesca subsp. vesca TaxID=101020 RepID=UPI0002C34FEA|nr:PREDICTED: NAC domain-containing protein 43-like [Fragaria vesca subsp. vesca]
MAVPMQGVNHVPVGFRSKPTEEELLCYYLRRKIRGLRLPQGVVHHNCNVYGKKEPWDIWEAYRDPSDPETKELYFFRDEPRRVFSCSTIRRVDTGNWRGENLRKKVHAYGSDRVIGWRRTFVYTNRDSVQDGCWLINELELHESLFPSKDKRNSYVLCILTKIDKKGKH